MLYWVRQAEASAAVGRINGEDLKPWVIDDFLLEHALWKPLKNLTQTNAWQILLNPVVRIYGGSAIWCQWISVQAWPSSSGKSARDPFIGRVRECFRRSAGSDMLVQLTGDWLWRHS
jgi:hypothetical protein